MKKSKEEIKFLKVRDVKSPNRAFEYDAGIDFFVPKFTKDFVEDLKEKNPLIFDNSGNYSYTVSAVDANSTGQWLKTTNNMSPTITMASGTTNNVNIKYELDDDNNSQIKYDEEKGLNYFILAPHSRVMIPSGIKSRMADVGRALIAANKSGIATKSGLVYGAQVVDYTYKGEIHLSLINTSTKIVKIYEDMKIIQFVETPVYFSKVIVYDAIETLEAELTFHEGLEDDRGAGGFGSTDEK